MSVRRSLQAGRKTRQHFIFKLAAESGLDGSTSEAIEFEAVNPSLSMVKALAVEFSIPPSWMH